MLYVCHRVFAVSDVMSGCLDKCTCPDWEIWNTIRERRNFLSSVIAGAMVCMIQHVCLSMLCAMLSLLTEVELCSKSEHVFLCSETPVARKWADAQCDSHPAKYRWHPSLKAVNQIAKIFALGKIPLGARTPKNIHIVYQLRCQPSFIQKYKCKYKTNL